MRFLLVLAAAVASALALENLPQPYLWIALIWFTLLLFAVVMRVRFRPLWFNLAVLLLLVAGAEGRFAYRNHFLVEGYDPGEYIKSDHADLGYSVNPDQQVRARRRLRDEQLYDVVYTIDSSALRVAPPVAEGGGVECILFFGGSFTFGEGLDDDVTLPYQTGVKTGGEYRVYNFGLHGYGPHQMLAALESGYVDDRIECKPRFVIYQGIWFHAFRSAGMELWDPHGPHYVKRAGEQLKRIGRFDDDFYLDTRRKIFERLYRSSLFSELHQRFRRPEPKDYALYLAILDESRRLVESRYPGSEFHIVFWDEPWLPIEGIFESDSRFHRVGKILPEGWRADRTPYQVHKLDFHPSALAQDYVASYIATEIVGRAASDGER